MTCARTDIGYINSPTSEWSKKREARKQQESIQQQQQEQLNELQAHLLQIQQKKSVAALNQQQQQNDNMLQSSSNITPEQQQALDPATAALLMANPRWLAQNLAQQQHKQGLTQQQQLAQMAMFDPRLALLPPQQLNHLLMAAGMDSQKQFELQRQQQRQQNFNPLTATSSSAPTNSQKNSIVGQTPNMSQNMVKIVKKI